MLVIVLSLLPAHLCSEAGGLVFIVISSHVNKECILVLFNVFYRLLTWLAEVTVIDPTECLT